MFTGLVEGVGTVEALVPQGPGVELTVACPELFTGLQVGQSIAINGCCLTAVGCAEGCARFEAGEETLQCTNLGTLQAGSRVNLERSLRVGDRLGGHFVTGHVDCVGRIMSRTDDADWSLIWFSIQPPWSEHLAAKGSIAVDGISLTLVDVGEQAFSVALIPHTLQCTTLGQKGVGDPVNLETDILAKYVAQAVRFRPA